MSQCDQARVVESPETWTAVLPGADGRKGVELAEDGGGDAGR